MENNQHREARFYITTGAFAFVFILFLLSAVNPPAGLSDSEKIISIDKGTTLSETAKKLKNEGIIKYEFPFEALVIITAGEDGVVSGEYLFKHPQNAIETARRIVNGNYGFENIKITLPEGSTTLQMADILSGALPAFQKEEFIARATKDEGYLFPDTYFFPSNAKTEEVVTSLKNNFSEKMKALEERINSSGRAEKEIIIIASILEKEVPKTEDRKIVSGILWKRLKIGMPLQVDATFLYYLGKRSDELTEADLKTDTLYNTYTRKGLPQGPIGNPGLDSILSAIEPTDSPYFFYLSDKNGETHYAVDFDGHRANKAKYLK